MIRMYTLKQSNGAVYNQTFEQLVSVSNVIVENTLSPPYFLNPTVVSSNTIRFDNVTVTCSHLAENIQYLIQPTKDSILSIREDGFGAAESDDGWFSGNQPSKGWGPTLGNPDPTNGRKPYQFTSNIGLTPSDYSPQLQTDVTNGVYGVHFTYDFGQPVSISSSYFVIPSGKVQLTLYSPRRVFFFTADTNTQDTDWIFVHTDRYEYPFQGGFEYDGGYTFMDHEYIFSTTATGRYWRAVIAEAGTGYLFIHSVQFRGQYIIPSAFQLSENLLYSQDFGYLFGPNGQIPGKWYLSSNEYFVNTTKTLDPYVPYSSNSMMITLEVAITAPEILTNGQLYTNGPMTIQCISDDFIQTEYIVPEQNIQTFTPLLYSSIVVSKADQYGMATLIPIQSTYPNVLSAYFTDNSNTRQPRIIPATNEVYTLLSDQMTVIYGHHIDFKYSATSNVTIGSYDIPETNSLVILKSTDGIIWNIDTQDNTSWTGSVRTFPIGSPLWHRIVFLKSFDLTLLRFDGYTNIEIRNDLLSNSCSIRTNTYDMTIPNNKNPCDIVPLTRTYASGFVSQLFTECDFYITFQEPTTLSFIDVYSDDQVKSYRSNTVSLSYLGQTHYSQEPLVPGNVWIYGSNSSFDTMDLIYNGILSETNKSLGPNGIFKNYNTSFTPSTYTYWKLHIQPPDVHLSVNNPYGPFVFTRAQQFNMCTFRMYRPFIYENYSNVQLIASVNSDTVNITAPKNTPLKIKLGRNDKSLSCVVNGVEYMSGRVITTPDIQLITPTIGPFIGRYISYTAYPQFTLDNAIWHVYNNDPTKTYTFDVAKYIAQDENPMATSNIFPNGFSLYLKFNVPYNTELPVNYKIFEVRNSDFLINSYGSSIFLSKRLDGLFNLMYSSSGYTVQYSTDFYRTFTPGYEYIIRGTVAPDGISLQIDDDPVFYTQINIDSLFFSTPIQSEQVMLMDPYPIPDIHPVTYISNPETISIDLKRNLDIKALEVIQTSDVQKNDSYTLGVGRYLNYTVDRIHPQVVGNVYWITNTNLCQTKSQDLVPPLDIKEILGYDSEFNMVRQNPSLGAPVNLSLPVNRIPKESLIVQNLNWTITTERRQGYTFTDTYSYIPGVTYYKYNTEFSSFVQASFDTQLKSNSAYYGTLSGDGTLTHSIDMEFDRPGQIQLLFTVSYNSMYFSSDGQFYEFPTLFYEMPDGTYRDYPFNQTVEIPEEYDKYYDEGLVTFYVNEYTYIRWANGSYYSMTTGLFSPTVENPTIYYVPMKLGVVKHNVLDYYIYSATTLGNTFKLETDGGYVYYDIQYDVFKFTSSIFVATLFRLSDTGVLTMAATRRRIGIDSTNQLRIISATYFPSFKFLKDGRITFNVFPGYQNFDTLLEVRGDIQVTPTTIQTPNEVTSLGTYIRYNDRVVPIVSRSGNVYTITDGTNANVDMITIGFLNNVYFSLYYISKGFVLANDPFFFKRVEDDTYDYTISTTCIEYNIQSRQKTRYSLYDSDNLLWKSGIIDVYQPIGGSWLQLAPEEERSNVSDVTFYGSYNMPSYTSSNTGVTLTTNAIRLSVSGEHPTFVPSSDSVFDMRMCDIRYNTTYRSSENGVYTFNAPIVFNEIRGAQVVKATNDPTLQTFTVLDLPYTSTPFQYYKVDPKESPEFIRQTQRTIETRWAPFTIHTNIFTDHSFIEDFPYTSRIRFEGLTPSSDVQTSNCAFNVTSTSNGFHSYTLDLLAINAFTFVASNLMSFITSDGVALGFTREKKFIEQGITTTALTSSEVVYTGYIVEDSISSIQKSIYVYTTNTISYIETSDFPDVPAFTNVTPITSNVFCVYPTQLVSNTLVISRGFVDYPDYNEISNGTKVYIQNNSFIRTTYTGSDISIGLVNRTYIPGEPITLPNFTSDTAESTYKIVLTD